MAFRALKWVGIASLLGPVAWVVFVYFSRPVVVLHYSEHAIKRLGYFFNNNHNITKRGLSPGETVKFPTAMFPAPDTWILLTFPRERGDIVEITEPFSRIDVCIVEGGGIERTVVRHGFFDRFTDLNPPCDSAPES
ncbi:hypothetical protein N7373_10045 [Achromobacter mucicolens]|uniref:hypothetical protein n=1 Tax=Achromobacter mucicolens TaxID=1389922 RepID=UPI00244ABFFA|nr:hypothetical protein [Achromobacter mucicolens]MDH0091782.1 hypothetical protein [Achromobacter mucicolens]